MDAKNSPHALSPSSSNNGQEQLIPVRQNRPSTSSTSPPAPDRSNSPRIAGDEHTPCSTPPASDTDHQDPHRNPASTRPRKSRKPNNGKSALFWVHMDPQSVSEGAREDTLKSIRSHVMSEHNRKKRLESTRRYKTKPWKHLAFQPVETTASVAGQSGSSRAIPCPDDQDSESVIREEEDEPVTDVVGFPASSPATANPGGHHAITFANPPMKTSPWTYLGSGANDPFSMTHTPLSDRMLRHLQHCQSPSGTIYEMYAD